MFYENLGGEAVASYLKIGGYQDANDLFLSYLASKLGYDFDYLKEKLTAKALSYIHPRRVRLEGDEDTLYNIMIEFSEMGLSPKARNEGVEYDLYEFLGIEYNEGYDRLDSYKFVDTALKVDESKLNP